MNQQGTERTLRESQRQRFSCRFQEDTIPQQKIPRDSKRPWGKFHLCYSKLRWVRWCWYLLDTNSLEGKLGNQ